jgi:hypothetical protein
MFIQVPSTYFLWHSKDPHGISRGILLGVDQSMFDIGSIDEGVFMLSSN